VSATGGDANIPLQASPKGTGKFTVTDGTDTTKKASFDISAVATGTDRTITMPNANVDLQYARAASETVAGGVELATTAEVQTGTDTVRAVTPAGLQNGKLVLGTAQATTSGTEKDFTIPAWAKRVTITLVGVSTNGTSALLVQLGDADGIENTGYSSSASAGTTDASSNAGFLLTTSFVAAGTAHGGAVLWTHEAGGLTWAQNGNVAHNGSSVTSAGSKTLTGALTTVRVTSVTPNTFDAGSVNVIWE
jgi:hypothetical protein